MIREEGEANAIGLSNLLPLLIFLYFSSSHPPFFLQIFPFTFTAVHTPLFLSGPELTQSQRASCLSARLIFYTEPLLTRIE